MILEHDKKRFPERVDFIQMPGYLWGKESRTTVGLKPKTGPYAVVTTLGLFHFDEQGEMVLMAYHPSTSVQEVKKNVQLDLTVSKKVKPLEPPNEEELNVLRNQIDPQGMYLRNARSLKGRKLSV